MIGFHRKYSPKANSRGSRPFSQGGHWDNWNGSGDPDGKKGEKGRQGREEGKRRQRKIERPQTRAIMHTC